MTAKDIAKHFVDKYERACVHTRLRQLRMSLCDKAVRLFNTIRTLALDLGSDCKSCKVKLRFKILIMIIINFKYNTR